MGSGKLTTAPEVVAYLAAHAFGLVLLYLLNPIVLGTLVQAGGQASLRLAALAMSLVMMIIVMLLFFIARRALAGNS